MGDVERRAGDESHLACVCFIGLILIPFNGDDEPKILR